MTHFTQLYRNIALCCCTVFLFASCGTNSNTTIKQRPQDIAVTQTQLLTPQDGDPIATIETPIGNLYVVLFPQHAPMAVENFTTLAQNGAFQDMPIHRIVSDFLVQSGDATGSGGVSIWNSTPFPTEPSSQLHHFSGALCTASDSETGYNLSQFYFVQTPAGNVNKSTATALVNAGVAQSVADDYRSMGGAPALDGKDTVFGQIYHGMDVLDTLALTPCDENGTPIEPVYITAVTIGTYDTASAPTASTLVTQDADE